MTTATYILTIIFGLAATILACVFCLSKKWKHEGGFKQWLHEFVNFKTLFIDKIFKFLYILSTCCTFFFGFFTLFSEQFLAGLAVMILGPIAVRIVYELLMMFIIMVTSLTDINRDVSNMLGIMRGGKAKGKPEEAAPVPEPSAAPTTVYCSNCGTPYNGSAANCPNCGEPNIFK